MTIFATTEPKALSGYGLMQSAALSDLFFNRDHSEAAVYDRGKFDHYDDDALLKDADSLLQCLKSLGVEELPTPQDMVADFYHRL